MKKQFTTLLNKEMDRKDFLKYLATAGFMAMGGGLILQSLGGLDKVSGNKTVAQASGFGYGASAYGGQPKNQ